MTASRPVALRVAVGGMLFAVLVTLSGCFENGLVEGRLSVTVRADQLLVDNCGTEIAGPFSLLIDKSARQYSYVFAASSDSDWKVGEVLSTAAEGWAKVKYASDPRLAPGDLLYVSYLSTDGGAAGSHYVIPKRGLSDGKWLRFDGSVSSEPCPSQ